MFNTMYRKLHTTIDRLRKTGPDCGWDILHIKGNRHIEIEEEVMLDNSKSSIHVSKHAYQGLQ